ncbi:glycerol-3-phosphate responsive antiterminator [Terriglobus sp. ADX1]
MESTNRIGAYHATGEVNDSRSSVPSLSDRLLSSPIIAAVNTMDMFEAALHAPPKSLYLLTGNPMTLPQIVKRARDSGKGCLVNVDFLNGLSRDREAIEYLAAHKVEGIVSTRFDVLKVAQSLGLLPCREHLQLIPQL